LVHLVWHYTAASLSSKHATGNLMPPTWTSLLRYVEDWFARPAGTPHIATGAAKVEFKETCGSFFLLRQTQDGRGSAAIQAIPTQQ
jgi:hypothetical protein